eukprot:scaffold31216_cov40-Prasinocladus_malaysianus.AAC.1
MRFVPQHESHDVLVVHRLATTPRRAWHEADEADNQCRGQKEAGAQSQIEKACTLNNLRMARNYKRNMQEEREGQHEIELERNRMDCVGDKCNGVGWDGCIYEG